MVIPEAVPSRAITRAGLACALVGVVLLGIPPREASYAAAPPQPERHELGLSGYVLAPDGTPVAAGRVAVLSSPLSHGATTASIDRDGRFRVVPAASGVALLLVNIPGFAPYRVIVMVPPSKTVTLPVIRLWPASYFRARFVSPDGEPITSPRVVRETLDTEGAALLEPFGLSGSEIAGDGTITIGPLPLGRTILAVDPFPFAPMRLSDLQVTGVGTLFDGGTVTVTPGAVLHVDIVDETGAAVAGHAVFIQDAETPSPLPDKRAESNLDGRATFDRLSAGRYRLWTTTRAPCNDMRRLTIGRIVAVAGNGTLLTRLTIGGRAVVRLSSPLGALSGATITLSPESATTVTSSARAVSRSAPFVRRPGRLVSEASCRSTTDADGVATLVNVPPGPARLRVGLQNSTYVRNVTVPAQSGDVTVVVPEGFLPVRVIHAITKRPIAGASITWRGGGAQVEATSLPTGDALLEGTGATAGTLSVSAPGYENMDVQLTEMPASTYEIALVPTPATSLRVRVATASGSSLASAVVQVLPERVLEIPQIAATGSTGVVTFANAPPGPLRVAASADGFLTTVIRLPEGARDEAVVGLPRGYRVIADIDMQDDPGPLLIRLWDESGASMDAMLDSRSDRRIDRAGRVSLGPLPPGRYVVELQGSREPRRARVSITDRDVLVALQ